MTKGLVRANNFSDLADKDEAVVNLGLSAADYAALKGLYTTAGIDFAVIGEIGNSQGNYQAQLDGIGTTLSGVVLSGYVNRSGDTILGTWTHSGIINISSGLPSGYPASTDSLFSLSIESGEAVIVASGLIASGLSYNGVRQSSSTVQRAFPPSGFSPLHLIPLQVGGQSFFAEAGESPSFYIDPVGRGHALDLVTGNLLGTYNSASPAWAVGPDGVLFQPAANAPVIEYDPATLACLGARIWGVTTNLLLQSNTFNTTWTRNNVTITSNATASVDGGINGSTLLVNSVGAALAQGSQSFAAGSTLTVSIFAKKNASNFLRFELGNLISCWFDLNTGTTGTNQAGSGNVLFSGKSIEQWQNGWYRCSLTVTTTTITTIGVNVFPTNANGASSSVNSSVFIFGAQLNPGPLAPYVPTTTTAASSTADVWSITGADFSRIYNQSAVTFYAEATRDTVPGTEFPVLIDARTASNFEIVQCSYLTETVAGSLARSNNAIQAELYPTGLANIRTRRIAAAFAQDNFATCANGGTVLTDSSGTMPSPDRISLGSTSTGQFLNGYIRELAIFRSRRPNTNLQAMTS